MTHLNKRTKHPLHVPLVHMACLVCGVLMLLDVTDGLGLLGSAVCKAKPPSLFASCSVVRVMLTLACGRAAVAVAVSMQQWG